MTECNYVAYPGYVKAAEVHKVPLRTSFVFGLCEVRSIWAKPKPFIPFCRLKGIRITKRVSPVTSMLHNTSECLKRNLYTTEVTNKAFCCFRYYHGSDAYAPNTGGKRLRTECPDWNPLSPRPRHLEPVDRCHGEIDGEAG